MVVSVGECGPTELGEPDYWVGTRATTHPVPQPILSKPRFNLGHPLLAQPAHSLTPDVSTCAGDKPVRVENEGIRSRLLGRPFFIFFSSSLSFVCLGISS